MTEKDTAKKMAVVLTERIRPELMTCEDVVNTGRYPYTGRLGILSEEDHQKVREAMKLVLRQNWQTVISQQSVTDRDREYCWPGHLSGTGDYYTG